MDVNFRHVAWANTDNFRVVAEALAKGDDASLKYASEVIGAWLTRLPPSKIPRSILCTYHLLVAYLENSDQSLALALMRFVSLLSSEDQDRDRPYLAAPLLSLARQAGLPSWLVDLRNDVAHGSLPSPALLASGFHWASKCLTEFWLANASHMSGIVTAHNDLFNAAVVSLGAILKGSDGCPLKDVEAALANQPLSIPLIQRAVRLFLSLTLHAKRKRSRILDVCSSAAVLLDLMRRKHVLHHFVLCFLLSGTSESGPNEFANWIEWSLCWTRAISQRRLGKSCDLSKYLDDEICAMFDWRRAVKHVLYDNCCLQTRDLCVELIGNIPDHSAEVKDRLIYLLDLYLGLVSVRISETSLESREQSENVWSHSDLGWADVPLGADIGHSSLISECPTLAGENAPTSRQYQGFFAQDTTSRCKVRQDKGE